MHVFLLLPLYLYVIVRLCLALAIDKDQTDDRIKHDTGLKVYAILLGM